MLKDSAENGSKYRGVAPLRNYIRSSSVMQVHSVLNVPTDFI